MTSLLYYRLSHASSTTSLPNPRLSNPGFGPTSSLPHSISSPLISSSAFAQFDYFSPEPEPHPRASSTLRRRSTQYAPAASRPMSMGSGSRVVSFDAAPTRTSVRNAGYWDSRVSTVDVGSPNVPSIPETDASTSMREKRAVVTGEKGVVNWARPLRTAPPEPVEPVQPGESDPPTFAIFGTSTQRSRRLKKLSPTIGSPQSGGAGWTCPTDPPAASWTLPPVPSTAQSSPELAWPESPSTASYSGSSGSALADYLDSPSLYYSTPSQSPHIPSRSSSIASPASPAAPLSQGPSRGRLMQIMSTSESMTELASPTSLAELQFLRQAAFVLEEQAKGENGTKRPVRTWSPPSASGLRIKRKAVPTTDAAFAAKQTFNTETDPLSVRQPSPPILHTPTNIALLAIDLRAKLKHSQSTADLSALSTTLPARPMYILECVPPPHTPFPPTPPLFAAPAHLPPGKRSLYDNLKASISAFDLSTPKAPRRSHAVRRSVDSESAGSDAGSLNGCSSDGMPVTPPAGASMGRFQYADTTADKGTGKGNGKKGNKGISRFFRKPLEA